MTLPANLQWSSREHEEGLVRGFVVSAKKQRFLELFAKPRRRKTILDLLYHFADFDPRFAKAIATGSPEPAELLRQRAAPRECYVISTDRSLDGKHLPLVEALRALDPWGSQGTIISCIPGELAYYEGEAPSNNYLLTRTDGLAPSAARSPQSL